MGISLQQPSSISERRPASTAMAFSLHYHCLCRVLGRVWYLLARSIDLRCTQPDWDAAGEQFSLLFVLWLLSDKRGAEISQNLYQMVKLISRIDGLIQSWSSTSLQVTSVSAGIFQIFVVCWNKGWFVDKLVDIVKRHCQCAVDMNPERSDWPTRRHCLVFVAQFNTPKVSHEVNKSCVPQHVVAQGGYASEVVRISQNTAWRCRKNLGIFSFESATVC